MGKENYLLSVEVLGPAESSSTKLFGQRSVMVTRDCLLGRTEAPVC